MKTQILLILILILSSSVFSHAQTFTPQTPAFQTGNGIAVMRSICAVDNNTAFIAGFEWDPFCNIIQKTTDGGTTWSIVDTSSIPYYQKICFYDADTGYIAGGSIRKTTDGGMSWQVLDTTAMQIISGSLKIFLKSSSEIWVTGWNGKYTYSKDYGNTWHVDSLQQPSSTKLHDIIFVNDTIGFMSGIQGRFYKTTDGGYNWTQINMGSNQDLWSFAWSGTRLFILSGMYVDDIYLKADTICYTDDFNNWICERLDTLLNRIVFVNDTVGFGTGTYDQSSWNGPGYVVRTIDKGQNWDIIFTSPNFPLYRDGFYQLAFADINHGWVMDEYRIFYTANAITSTINEYNLESIHSYPNPCIDKLTVMLNQLSGNLELLIYDLTGRIVYRRSAIFGQKKIEIDVSDLKQGLYLYKVNTKNEEIITGKFIKINH